MDTVKDKIMDIIIKLLIYILAAVFIYQAILKLTGHSWQLEALIIAILSFFAPVMFKTKFKVEKMENEFSHFKRSFYALASDFKDFKEKQQNFNHRQELFNYKILHELKEIKNKL